MKTEIRRSLLDLRLVAILLGVVLHFGCADTGFTSYDQGGQLVDLEQQRESPFSPLPDYGPPGDAYQCYSVIDLVFVLDVSSSMSFILEKLAVEVDKVVDAANKLAPDSHFGLVGFVDNHLIDLTGPLEGGKVHTDTSTLSQAFTTFRQVYTAADRNPGDGTQGKTLQNPICEENANDALQAAATQFPWRPLANRVIILATDDYCGNQ